MALSRPDYGKNDLVFYKNRLCVVNNITSPLGYRLFDLSDIETCANIYGASILDLTRVELGAEFTLPLDNDGDIDPFIAELTRPVPTYVPVPAAGPAVKIPRVTPTSTITTQEPGLANLPMPALEQVTEPLPEQADLPTAPGPRFKDITEQDVDNLAASRTSKSTDKQTKWGIKMFKGS